MRNIFMAVDTETVDTFKDSFASLNFGNIGEHLASKLLVSLIVIIIGTVITKLVVKSVKGHFTDKDIPFGGVNFICDMVKFVLHIAVAITVASVMGIPVETAVIVILAVMAGAAYILKDNLVLITSGIAIMITKPFEKGDYIEVPDEGVKGYVLNIGLVRTTLRTKDFKEICLPNNIVNTKTLINYSKIEGLRRVELMVPTPYEADIDLAESLCVEAAKNCEYVKQDKKIVAWVNDLGEHSIVIRLTCFVYWDYIDDAYAALRDAVIRLYNRNGLYIPFNQIDVHMIEGE